VAEKDFHFTKEWWVNGKQEKEEAWPVNVTIPSFTLVRFLEYDGHTSANQDPNFSAVFANISESSTNIQPDNSSRVDGTSIILERDGEGNGFKYTVTGLPKYGSMEDNGQKRYGEWKYRVSEAKVNGYNEPVYLKSDGIPKQGTSYAEDGERIKNVLITVSLPSTGGVGTGVVYGAGAAVILLALLGLVLMNRKRGRGTGI
jgi:LPXTG-motif cell wall-anchored protein